MKQIEVDVKERKELGKKSKKVRARGALPAIVYGRGIDSFPIEVEKKAFIKAVTGDAGTNVIIKMKITDGEKPRTIPVITHGVSRDPLTDEILHIDFVHIIMTEEIKTKVHVVLIGEAFGVKEKEGVLISGLRELEIKCLPADIPDNIEVDVSGLDIGNSIPVADLKLPKGVEVLSNPEEMIAAVSAPTKEEDMVAPVSETLEGEPLAEGEVPAEGAAAPKAVPAGRQEGEKPAAEAKPGAKEAAAPKSKDAKPAAKKEAPPKK